MILRLARIDHLETKWQIVLGPPTDQRYPLERVVLEMTDEPIASIGDYYRLEPLRLEEIPQILSWVNR